MATRGDRAWYYPDQGAVDSDTPIAALVYLVDAGPPETVSVRLLAFVPDDDSAIGPAPDGGFTYDVGPFETSATPAAGKVVIDADATGAEFDALETRMDAVEAEQVSDDGRLDSLESADVTLDARIDALETAAFTPARGEVVLTGGGGLSLSSSWTTLTGGTATGSGISYDAGTGVLTVPAGTYRLDFSATQSRTLGLTAPDLECALFVDGVQSNAYALHTLAAIADARTACGYAEVTVASSAAVTLRTRSSLTLQIVTSRYQFSARRIA